MWQFLSGVQEKLFNSQASHLQVYYIHMFWIYIQNFRQIRGMAGKFVDTISIFNRKRNSVKMNKAGFANIFHEQIDEIL